jgi:26S proteasome regulatory subunit N13
MEQATLLSAMGGGSHTAETPAPAARPAVAATPMAGVEATPATEAMAPPSTAPAAPHKTAPVHTPGATPAPRGAVGMQDLQSILSGMGMPQAGGMPASTASVAAAALAQALLSAGAGRGGGGATDTSSLADVLTPDVLMPLLAAEGVQERLAPYLPEAHRNSSALMELIGSPQFSSQLQSFSRALQSGQIDLAQFGLRAASGVSVAQFLEEIQNQAGSSEQQQPPEGGAPPPQPPQ